MAADSTNTLRVKNFDEMLFVAPCPLPNFCFLPGLKMAAKNDGKMSFLGKMSDCVYPGGQDFRQITLSDTVSKIKMFTKNGRKMIFCKSWQMAVFITCRS